MPSVQKLDHLRGVSGGLRWSLTYGASGIGGAGEGLGSFPPPAGKPLHSFLSDGVYWGCGVGGSPDLGPIPYVRRPLYLSGSSLAAWLPPYLSSPKTSFSSSQGKPKESYKVLCFSISGVPHSSIASGRNPVPSHAPTLFYP